MRLVSSPFGRRRGAVAPLVAFLVVFLMGMVAFAVDIGWIVLTQSELQNAADFAALAGVKPLMDGYVLYNLQGLSAAQQNTILTTAQNNAIANAQAIASYYTAGGISNLALNSGDIQFGFIDGSGNYSTNSGNFPNTITVTMRRDSSANGALTLFLGPVLGVQSTSITASAAATMYGGAANSLQKTLTGNINMLPVAYDVNAWNGFVASGLSPDGTSALSGGYPALQVYPSATEPDNFGRLSLDASHTGTSSEIGWVNNGLAQSNVNALFSAGLLPVSSSNTTYNWLGQTGMKASLISAVNARAGTQFLLPLFTPYNSGVPLPSDYAAAKGSGSPYYYAIVQFVGVTVVSGSSGVTVQPSAFLDPNLVFGSPPVPVGTGTGLVTTFAAPKLSQ
jgi:Putative Flp pilus-assembly TadE/G-like